VLLLYIGYAYIYLLFFLDLASLLVFMCLPSAQSLESEQKKDDQQLKQATERAAVLQEELILATDRERQLQMQLDKMKDDVIQLQTRLEHQSKEFDDFKLRSVRLWEQEMEKRESTCN